MLFSRPLAAAIEELARWAGRSRRRYRVTGPSMEPTLADGEFVLVDPNRRPCSGEVGLAVHPDDEAVMVMKRVADVTDEGLFVLSSDNPAGTDSRAWGPVSPASMRGTVTLILDRPLASLGEPSSSTSGPPASDRGPSNNLSRWLRR